VIDVQLMFRRSRGLTVSIFVILHRDLTRLVDVTPGYDSPRIFRRYALIKHDRAGTIVQDALCATRYFSVVLRLNVTLHGLQTATAPTRSFHCPRCIRLTINRAHVRVFAG